MSEIIDAPRLIIPERHRAAQKMVDYNNIDCGGMNVEEAKKAQLEFYYAQKIGERLMATYPQRQWGVYFNASGGFAQITCPSLSTEYGYILHISKHPTLHALQEAAIRAGGEILERYGISRARVFDKTTVDQLPRNENDEAISPDATPTIWIGSRPPNKKE
jgi:hypothetical protein